METLLLRKKKRGTREEGALRTKTRWKRVHLTFNFEKRGDAGNSKVGNGYYRLP